MFFLNNSDENKGNLCKIILTTFEYSGGGGGGITCICRDKEMCHYFGYFLGVLQDFWVPFLGYSRIIGYHFFW